MYVCVCVCVFIIFDLLASSYCKTSVTHMRCSDQRSFVLSMTRGFCQLSSSSTSESIIFHFQRRNSCQPKNWREKRYLILDRRNFKCLFYWGGWGGLKFRANKPKLGLKLDFLLLSVVWFISFPLPCTR